MDQTNISGSGNKQSFIHLKTFSKVMKSLKSLQKLSTISAAIFLLLSISTMQAQTKLTETEGDLQLTNPGRYITFFKDSVQSYIEQSPNTAMYFVNRTPGDLNFYNQSKLALQLRGGAAKIGGGLHEAMLNVRINDDISHRGLKIENSDGHADTWLPYSDGGIYLTGDYDPGNNNPGNITLRTYNSNFPNNGYVDRLIVQGSTGNVSIGTTAASGKLHVKTADSNNPAGYFENGSVNGLGIQGWAKGSGGIGVSGISQVSEGVGVYGSSLGTNSRGGSFISSNIGATASGTNFDFYASGPGMDYGSPSSIRWKTELQEITNISHVMDKIKPYSYVLKSDPTTHNVGFIAEEVMKYFPEITIRDKHDQDFAIGLDYSRMTVILWAIVSEQGRVIEELKSKISSME